MVAVDAADDAVLAAAVRRVVGHADFAKLFKHPVKFDGTNFVETRLTLEQQSAEVTRFATGKLHVFLERYGTLLPQEEIRALSQVSGASTAEVRFWIERLLQQPLSESDRQKQSRRRRWAWAQREMDRAEGFFSEDAMKERDPTLYHHFVGRHLEEGDDAPPAPATGKLSTFLLEQLDKECAGGASSSHPGRSAEGGPAAESDDETMSADGERPPRRAQGKRAREQTNDPDTAFRGGEGADDDGLGDVAGGTDDAAVRRANFLKVMRDRFVNGGEPSFAYAALDDDSDLDDVAELNRDAEERYFDDD